MKTSLEYEKGEQACKILEELGIDAWLVWVRETSQMADPVLDIILGGDLVWQSGLIYTKKGEKIAVIGSLDADGIRAKGLFSKIVEYDHSVRKPLVEELNRIAPEQIAINFSRNDVAADGLSVGMYNILQDYLKGTPYVERLTSAETLIGKLRGRKTETEITRIQRAVDITEEIFTAIESELKVGMSELEISKRMKLMMADRGVTDAWDPNHNPAVDAGPNKQFGHAGPTDNKIKNGHLLHFDFGVKWDGYCSDIQRMYFFGKPSDVPEDITHAFDTVRDTIQKSAEFVRPGVKGNDVDTLARDYVKEQGYEEYRHALGHQLGQLAHDGGTLLGPYWEKYGETPSGLLEPGNVFTLELYVTTKEYGQVSLEEDIVVTKDGCKFLSKPQKQIICVY